VLHTFIVTDGKGMPNCWEWLSKHWQLIHLASIVWVKTLVDRKLIDAQKLAQYTITQYTVDQGDRYVTVRWSRKTFMPMRPADLIKACYRSLKAHCFYFEPWHLKERVILGEKNPHYYAHVKMAGQFLAGHTYEVKGRTFLLDNACTIVEL